MKRLPLLAFIAGALISGIAVWSIKRTAPEKENYKERFLQLQSKFDRLAEADFQEYLSLKEQKARYEKADEILGKILLIMLNDLGLRRSEAQQKELAGRVQGKTPPSASEQAVPPSSAGAASAPAEKKDAVLTARSNGEGASDLKKEIAKVDEVDSENEAKELLEKLKSKDIIKDLQGGSILDPRRLDLLNGFFEGDAVFDDPLKNKPWHVVMEFTARMEHGKYVGHQDIKLSRDGKQFSHGRGDPNNDEFLVIPDDNSGIFISTYGGDAYFQLYYFPRLDGFYGLTYLKKGVGKFEKAGIVRLFKRTR